MMYRTMENSTCTHCGRGMFWPTEFYHFLSSEAVMWLQDKTIRRQFTGWETAMIHYVDFAHGYISYNTSSRHWLAGTLAVKTLYVNYGCKSEHVMSTTLRFLGLRPFDILKRICTMLMAALPPFYALKQWGYIRYFRVVKVTRLTGDACSQK